MNSQNHRVLFILLILAVSLPLLSAPAAPVDCPLASERLGRKAVGGGSLLFLFHVLLVDPEVNQRCGLGYDTDRWAVVRVGFYGATAPEFADLELDALFLDGIPADRIVEPDNILPGKEKGIVNRATVGPNAAEIWFPIPDGFWNSERDLKFEASADGLRFSDEVKVHPK
ncbi:MAG TPA: hypothetical protein VLU25_07635 [Acidobacteriota bacterium]|nr:hypothetical protein [Acidobacteriota bacterium]